MILLITLNRHVFFSNQRLIFQMAMYTYKCKLDIFHYITRWNTTDKDEVLVWVFFFRLLLKELEKIIREKKQFKSGIN
jgi:hypothetical protein